MSDWENESSDGDAPVVMAKPDVEEKGDWEDEDDWEKDSDEGGVAAPVVKYEGEVDWDDESEDEEPSSPSKAGGGDAPKKSKKKRKELLAKAAQKEVDPDQVPCEDPVEEKLRLKRLQEKADRELAGDLFSGFEKVKINDDPKSPSGSAGKAKKKEMKVVQVDEFEKFEVKDAKKVNELAGLVTTQMEPEKCKV